MLVAALIAYIAYIWVEDTVQTGAETQNIQQEEVVNEENETNLTDTENTTNIENETNAVSNPIENTTQVANQVDTKPTDKVEVRNFKYSGA